MKKKITLIISLIVGVAILSISSYYISIYNKKTKKVHIYKGKKFKKV